MKINISFKEKILKFKKFKKFKSIKNNLNNKNVSFYSEKLLYNYIFKNELNNKRICKNCNNNELFHYYPVLLNENKKVCNEFVALNKFDYIDALNFVAETEHSIKENILLNNITEKSFLQLKDINYISLSS